MAKQDYKSTQMQARREWLERKSTEELQAALDPLVKSGLYVNDGGKTLIRQILAGARRQFLIGLVSAFHPFLPLEPSAT